MSSIAPTAEPSASSRAATALDPAPGALASARRTLETEIDAMRQLAVALDGALGASVQEFVRVVRASRGRVVLSGIGKSGLIGRKIAATLASTGTPAMFVHASEASHGDLGMITGDDIVLAISASGESSELAAIIAYTRRFNVRLVAMTTNAGSTLGRAADLVLELPRVAEACPHGLAPTSSTILQLAVGDALAIALLESRGFTSADFRNFHPGGKLGANLKQVRDVMHGPDELPIVACGALMRDAIVEMTRKGFGCVGVVNAAGQLAGIITDGDLRRHLRDDVLSQPVDTIMTPSPKAVGPDILLARAIEMLSSSSITSLFVVESGRPVGLVHMHDLLRAGVA